MTKTTEQLIAEGRRYGRDIPHLVEPEDYGVLYDPEAIQAMEEMENWERIEMTPAELEKEKARLKATFSEPRKQISLRLSEDVIQRFKQMAKEEGIPYQTLMSSVLYKVANKKLSLEIV